MSDAPVTLLGIETSCDETAAAIVRLNPDNSAHILSDEVYSQIDTHEAFGGVVPELAARAHVEKLPIIIKTAFDNAALSAAELDGIAVTSGPGLIGGVMVGTMMAKAMAQAHNLPIVAVNHLEGHALSPNLAGDCPWPYLLLLVSGGHCQLLWVEALGKYTRLGSTLDDAVGEAFDKGAKLLGLGFPGGPEIEKCGLKGDPKAYDFPRPLLKDKDKSRAMDFSFAGLKTALRRAIEKETETLQTKSDLAASLQAAIGDILCNRSANAMQYIRQSRAMGHVPFVMAGGVAANRYLRDRLADTTASHGFRFSAPPLKWCTDNAVMIAYAGALRLKNGLSDKLDFAVRPRWPLDQDAALASPVYGSGKKGAKA